MQSYCFSAAHCCAGQLALAVHVVAGGIKVTSLEIFLKFKNIVFIVLKCWTLPNLGTMLLNFFVHNLHRGRNKLEPLSPAGLSSSV